MKNNLISPIQSSAVLIIAMLIANFLNFVFNAYLGRVLTLEDFALLAVINTLWFIIMIFINSISTTVNHFIAYYKGKDNLDFANYFLKGFRNRSLMVSIIATLCWIAITPILSNLLSIQDKYALLSIVPIISVGSLLAIQRGYLQGSFLFGFLSILVLAESISKLIYAYILVSYGLEPFVYLSIPFAVITALFFGYIFTARKMQFEVKNLQQENTEESPLAFYLTSVVNTIAGTAFLSFDILLVKHFLSPGEAGAYALLSLIGKMIYFLGTLLNSFVISYISRDIGQSKDYKTTFYKIFAISTLLTFLGYLGFGYFGHLTVPFLLGDKTESILRYVNLYGIGISAFTLSTTVVAFHLSKKNYLVSYVGLFSTLLMVFGLSMFHDSIQNVVYVITATSILHFVLVMLLHLYFLYWVKQPFVIPSTPPLLGSLANKLPVKVSICLPAHNEGKNIGNLLDKLLIQKTKNIVLNKIVVISSASTDNTNDIVRTYEKADSRVMLLTERKRSGKASAINLFLRHVDDPIVVVQSADTIPTEDTIEHLCGPFLRDEFVGMTGGAPIPVNDRNTFLGYVVHTWWWFHRHIPRFGEIIAFRNILPGISPNTAVDEAYIQAKFIKMGYRLKHVDEAVVYNKGAEKIRDMIKQRRRIHNGHSRLNEEESVKISHVTKNALWLLLFKYELKSVKEAVWLLGGICIEIIAILLAMWDKRVAKKNPVVWDMAKTTKNLVQVNVAKNVMRRVRV